MANEQNLTPFKKGEVANPNGRPKKYVTLLKEQGYKLAEINDTIQAMLSMDLDELARRLFVPFRQRSGGTYPGSFQQTNSP